MLRVNTSGITRAEVDGGASLAVALTPGDDSQAWRIAVTARCRDGEQRLGDVLTTPSSVLRRQQPYTWAWASQPGVDSWLVEVSLVSGSTAAPNRDLSGGLRLSSGPDLAQPGLVPHSGASLVRSGVAGAVALQPYERVRSLTAIATAAGATVTVAGQPAPIALVPNVGIELRPVGWRGDVQSTITFAGTDAYILELEI